MAATKYCENCNTECYWQKDTSGKWNLMDSETEEPHWTSCTQRPERGQFNGILKVKKSASAGPLKDLSVMSIIGRLEERVKKLEDKVNG